MLLLFDIDGTLVDAGGAGRRALNAAVQQVTGIVNGLDGVRLHGCTDPNILDEVLCAHLGRPLSGPEEMDRIMDAYCLRLQVELRDESSGYSVLPGAVALPTAAQTDGRFAVGLATGNIERGAELKLERGGLWSLFDFGGYGSDAAARSELVARGIERGQALAERRWGRRFSSREVVVLGDTERDVAAARAVGAIAVGVLGGSRYREALIAAEPDLLVESLLDARLWDLLGLGPPEPGAPMRSE